MKIGVLDLALDLSIQGYVRNLLRELRKLGVEPTQFSPHQGLPKAVDLYWDPRLTGGTPPWHGFRTADKPLVATLVGAAPLGMLPWELYADARSAVKGMRGVAKRLYEWHRVWRRSCAAIITISDFSKRQIETRLLLRGENLIPIPLGVDLDTFRPPDRPREREHLLHVSQYQPSKNLRRILSAYHALRSPTKPPLIAVVPLYPRSSAGPGVKIFNEKLPLEQLVKLYQRAAAFIFPSLHEGFGMPILEAMACGAPVITSTTTACPDTAGDAAMLVNPRSVTQIREAMRVLLEDPALATSLRRKGFERARSMTWRRCAEAHLRVFEQALERS